MKKIERIELLLTVKIEFNENLENIMKVLEFGNSEEKIRMLEGLPETEDENIIEKIISRLDDDDIKVRGEAFSWLILNKMKITKFLVKALGSPSKNIRGFSALVLANRNDVDSIPEIMRLANDERSMVRSCIVGALGYLKAHEAKEIILKSVFDPNLEVRKSGLQAMIDLKIPISDSKMKKFIDNDEDLEMKKLMARIKEISGPEGI